MARIPIVTALAPYYLASAYFALDGDTIETVEVDEETKPAGAVLDDWNELGCIEVAQLIREAEGGDTRYCPNLTTGLWEKRKTVGRTMSLVIEMTVQEVSEFLHRVAWNAAAIDGDDGEFVPNSQPEGIYRGWLLVQQQNGTEIVTLCSLRVELTMPNAMQIAGRTGATPQLRLEVMGNALNVGNFGTETAPE